MRQRGKEKKEWRKPEASRVKGDRDRSRESPKTAEKVSL
jgi:hypothetical protein